MGNSAEIALHAAATLGEGALWDARLGRLLWVDILERRVGLFDPASARNRTLQLDACVGTVVPAGTGDLMVALRHGFARLDPATGLVSGVVAPPEHDQASCRFNDGKCDPAGRFWAGTMALDDRPRLGSLYRLDADGRTKRILSGVSISNGIGWSPDGSKLYHIDTPTSVVAAYDYDAGTGEIRNRSIAVEIPASLGWPDGMTVDEEGMLWVALWDGGAVIRCDPKTGRHVGTHRLPASRITSCAFGGPGLRSLYVTSARVGLGAEELTRQPEAGSIFMLEPGVAGRPAFAYQG